MKIAIVYDAIWPYVTGGGERRYYELARRLAPRHELHFFGMKYWRGPDVVRTQEALVLHGVCQPRPLYVHGRRSIHQAVHFSFKLLPPLLREQFDLVDCCSVPYFPVYASKLCAVLRAQRLVVTWLEYWGDLWYEYLGWRGLFGKITEHVASYLPDKMIALSSRTKVSLMTSGASEASVSVIPCGVDIAAIGEVPPADTESDILFAGRLIREKNVDMLLRALKPLTERKPRLRCHILGDGPERERLQRLAHELDLDRNVRFFGFLASADEVYALMKASKVFALPSIREGFGLSVIEANACGLPVVTVDAQHNAAADLVVEGHNGYVCNPTPEAVAEKLELLLGDVHLRAKIAARAMQMAPEFDWDLIAQDVETFYHQMLTER